MKKINKISSVAFAFCVMVASNLFADDVYQSFKKYMTVNPNSCQNMDFVLHEKHDNYLIAKAISNVNIWLEYTYEGWDGPPAKSDVGTSVSLEGLVDRNLKHNVKICYDIDRRRRVHTDAFVKSKGAREDSGFAEIVWSEDSDMFGGDYDPRNLKKARDEFEILKDNKDSFDYYIYEANQYRSDFTLKEGKITTLAGMIQSQDDADFFAFSHYSGGQAEFIVETDIPAGKNPPIISILSKGPNGEVKTEAYNGGSAVKILEKHEKVVVKIYTNNTIMQNKIIRDSAGVKYRLKVRPMPLASKVLGEFNLVEYTPQEITNQEQNIDKVVAINTTEKEAAANGKPPISEIVNHTGNPAPEFDKCNGQGTLPNGQCNSSRYWKPGDKITFASWGPISSNDKDPNNLLSGETRSFRMTNDPEAYLWAPGHDMIYNHKYSGSPDGYNPQINYPNDFDSFRFYNNALSDVSVSVGGMGSTAPDLKINLTTDDGYLIGQCSRTEQPLHSNYSLAQAKALGLAVYGSVCSITNAKPGHYRIWVTGKTPGKYSVSATTTPIKAYKIVGRHSDYYKKRYIERINNPVIQPTNQEWIVDAGNQKYVDSSTMAHITGILNAIYDD